MPWESVSEAQKPPSKPAKKRFSFLKPKKPQIVVDKNELKNRLTPLQYKVTQEKHTER